MNKFLIVAIASSSVAFAAHGSTLSPLFTPSQVAVAQCGGTGFNGGSSLFNPVASGPSSSSCSTTDTSGSASATLGNLKAESSTSSTAPNLPDYGQTDVSWASLMDSVRVTPDDSSLLGTSGTFEMTFVVDGTLTGNSAYGWRVSEVVEGSGGALIDAPVQLDMLYEEIYYPPTGPSSTYSETQSYVGFSGGWELESGPGNTVVSFDITETVTATFDVVFGEYINYRFGLQAYSGNWTGLGGTSDFGNTATIIGFNALDASGVQLASTFVSSSGFVPGTASLSTIPLPATGWLLVGGFVGLAGLRRRRS